VKLLCVECDAPMKFQAYEGPEEGSLAIRFLCPTCGKSTALLTNSFETQLVTSLGVKIGGRTVPPEPMEQTRSSLESEGGKCPFANMLAEDQAQAKENNAVSWTPEAETRLERVPGFVRPMAKKAIEKYAEQKGAQEITESLLAEAREKIGM
jgi:hypothetical protein